MPLHEWSDRPGWEGMHHLWITELLRWVKPRLPVGYRAYIGSAPLLAVGAPVDRPDVGVRPGPPPKQRAAWAGSRRDQRRSHRAGRRDRRRHPGPGNGGLRREAGASHRGRRVDLTAQQRSSDRSECLPGPVPGLSARRRDLVLIDVHRRPVGFSFADQIATELDLEQPSVLPPMAVSYRVGEPAATGGRLLAIWRRPMTVGDSLPPIPLPLTSEQDVTLDLDQTYARAAEDAYQT